MTFTSYPSPDGVRACLELHSSRKIYLTAIWQEATYGLIEGFPIKPINDQIIANAIKTAQRYCYPDTEPFLIPPPLRSYVSRTSPAPKEIDTIAGFPAEFMPPITSVGVFRSLFPVNDPDKDYSRLVVVWFQWDFGVPTDEQVLEQLRALDWDTLATEHVL